LHNNTKICGLKYTSLHFVDRIDKSGSQGQGHQSLGLTVPSSTFLPTYPNSKQDYLWLGLFAEGPADSSSVLLCFIVISLSVPYAFINLACSFSLHALTSTSMASFSLSFPLFYIICATSAVCMSPVLTAIESLLAASLIRHWALSAPVTAFFLAVQLHKADLLNPLLFFSQVQCFRLFVWLPSCVQLLLQFSAFRSPSNSSTLSEHEMTHCTDHTSCHWDSSRSNMQSNGFLDRS